MDDRTNTIAGWVLASCGAALGLSIVSSLIYHTGAPAKAGYPIEAPADDAGGAAAAPEVPIATLLATADATKGADVFKKCGACHNAAQGGANGIGPNLYGIVGDAIAQGRGGYAFSDALKGIGGKWDFDKLNAWLTNPRKFASGTKMTFAGLDSEQDRANVIVYLNAQGSNLPLPAAPATASASGAGKTPPASAPANPGGKATPGAANLPDTASPASGAPSIDPAAAVSAAKAAK